MSMGRVLISWLISGQVGKKPRRGFLRSLFCCFGRQTNSKSSKLPPGSVGRGSPPLSPGSPRFLLPSVRHQDMHKKCMVIDLDETLVHSSFKVSAFFNIEFGAVLFCSGIYNCLFCVWLWYKGCNKCLFIPLFFLFKCGIILICGGKKVCLFFKSDDLNSYRRYYPLSAGVFHFQNCWKISFYFYWKFTPKVIRKSQFWFMSFQYNQHSSWNLYSALLIFQRMAHFTKGGGRM
jgi:hypothetical protein